MAQLSIADQTQVLLQSATRETAAAYFPKIIQALNADGIEVRLDAGAGQGKGVFATQDFEPEDLIFEEPPLVGLQHCANKPQALVCSHCFTYLGSVEAQVMHRALSRAIVDEAGKAHTSSIVQQLCSGTTKLPYSDEYKLPSQVKCPGGCAREVFCSEKCAEDAWTGYHCLLCTSSPNHEVDASERVSSSTDASANGPSCLRQPARRKAELRDFLAHAEATNDIFLLVARVLANIILTADRSLTHRQTHQSMYQANTLAVVEHGAAPNTTACRMECWEALQHAWQPYAMGWKALWWDCTAVPPDVEDVHGFLQDLKQLAEDSCMLLRDALYDERFPALFTLDVFGSLVGMFELNNLGIVVNSVLQDYFIEAMQRADADDDAKARAMLATAMEAAGMEEDEPCQGTAFYALQSCINHSCIPNAHAFKFKDSAAGCASMYAKEHIRRGEQVCISYIDEEQPYQDRQAALRDYGFQCQCHLCIEEAKT